MILEFTREDSIQYLIIINILGLIALLYFILSLNKKYNEKKSNVSKYLMIHFIMYLIAYIILTFYQYTILNNDINVELGTLGLGFISYAAIYLFLFYTELEKTSKTKKKIIISLGIFIGTWTIIVGFTDLTVGITYSLMTFYTAYVSIPIIYTCLKLKKRVEEKKNALTEIAIGGIVLIMYTCLVAISGVTDNGYLYIISALLQFTALTFFYLGYLVPSEEKDG